MPADLIIYAIVTAGLIFWLRSILGTRTGEERDRPLPYLKPDPEADRNNVLPFGDKGSNAEAQITELAQNPKNGMAIDNKSAELGLIELAQNDREFDIHKFMLAAQDAFVFIVESFADGDRATLQDLLAPDVYAAFEAAITQRERDGHRMKTEIVSIKQSIVTEARLQGKRAFVTIRFIAEETSVTYDKDDQIIHGHPEKVSQMRDLWVFSRDIKSRDPRWMLMATREDGDGDNEIIPNT